MHVKYVQGVSLLSVDWKGDRTTPSLKPTNTHLQCLTGKQRLHPKLNQYSRIEAGDSLLSKILHEHEFWKQKCLQLG